MKVYIVVRSDYDGVLIYRVCSNIVTAYAIKQMKVNETRERLIRAEEKKKQDTKWLVNNDLGWDVLEYDVIGD